MTRPELLYDDTYTGPRWTYGANLRPVATYNVPDGFILWSDRPSADFPLYGTVDYPRELTDKEVEHYTLTPVRSQP